MRNLLVAWVANVDGSILFGNIVQQFDEYPNILDIESTVSDYNPGATYITVLAITEMNDKDFNRFTK